MGETRITDENRLRTFLQAGIESMGDQGIKPDETEFLGFSGLSKEARTAVHKG